MIRKHACLYKESGSYLPCCGYSCLLHVRILYEKKGLKKKKRNISFKTFQKFKCQKITSFQTVDFEKKIMQYKGRKILYSSVCDFSHLTSDLILKEIVKLALLSIMWYPKGFLAHVKVLASCIHSGLLILSSSVCRMYIQR